MSALTRILSRINSLRARKTVRESGGFVTDYPGSGIRGINNALLCQIVDRLERLRGGNQFDRFRTENLIFVARDLERWHPTAQGILRKLKDYTLGVEGMKLHCTAKPGQDAGLAVKAMDFLDRFRDVEDWWDRERETYNRAHRDGEAIIRFWVEDDLVRCGYLEPEVIMPKDGSEEWTFGVRHMLGNPERVEAYCAHWPDYVEEIDAAEVYHIRCNVDRCIKRGVSDFSSTAEFLQEAYKTYRNFLQAEAVRQSYTYITEHAEGASAADIDTLLASQADYSAPAPTVRGLLRQVELQFKQGVGAEHISAGQKFSAMPSAENIQGMVSGVQAALLMAASRYGMPLSLLLADNNQNNVVDLGDESPFATYIRSEQSWYSKHQRNIYWKALTIAVAEGLLPDGTLEAVDVCVKPQQSPPRDPKAATERNQVLYSAGRLSGRSWDAAEGLETDTQQEEIAKEPKHPAHLAPDTAPLAPEKKEPAPAPAPVPVTESAVREKLAPRGEGLFELSHDPNLATLSVIKSGVVMEGGNDYCITGRLISFKDGAKPVEGDSVVASYVSPIGGN